MLWLICVRRRPPRSSTHNSGSRRPFDTLTGAFWGVIVDLVDVDVVDVDLAVDLVDAVGDVQGAVHRSAKQKKLRGRYRTCGRVEVHRIVM